MSLIKTFIGFRTVKDITSQIPAIQRLADGLSGMEWWNERIKEDNFELEKDGHFLAVFGIDTPEAFTNLVVRKALDILNYGISTYKIERSTSGFSIERLLAEKLEFNASWSFSSSPDIPAYVYQTVCPNRIDLLFLNQVMTTSVAPEVPYGLQNSPMEMVIISMAHTLGLKSVRYCVVDTPEGLDKIRGLKLKRNEEYCLPSFVELHERFKPLFDNALPSHKERLRLDLIHQSNPVSEPAANDDEYKNWLSQVAIAGLAYILCESYVFRSAWSVPPSLIRNALNQKGYSYEETQIVYNLAIHIYYALTDFAKSQLSVGT
jgi:hypothetical protein